MMTLSSRAVATAFASKPWAQALISAGALAGCTQGVNLVFEGPGGGSYALQPGDGGWTVTVTRTAH